MTTRLKRWFSVVEPDDVQVMKLRLIKEEAEGARDLIHALPDADPNAFLSLAKAITTHCDGNREKSLAIMRLRWAYSSRSAEVLDEALFWAHESIVNPS